ncbi:MAG: ATP-binding cassette domain-containing protein [Proteobacteria bacterium]|nr:ATP-binding cassette domain-containing protein [Pseudomonadota bacterium]
MLAIEARNVEYRYGQTIAVERSSFSVPEGAITALIGPNGSGKSTLLAGIAGIVTPTSGTMQVHQASTPRRIAFVLQTTKVNDALPITVREVVAMGRYPSLRMLGRLTDKDRSIIDDAMERMSITDISQQHLRELSGGQRQRVFVAQGLAQDHDLLLLDEPLTGLDLPSAQAIDSVIHEEQRLGRTIVMSTHDLAEARVSDHVILMAGRVIASGPPDEALTAETLREAYGAALLHDGGDALFLDDPAHQPTDGRHVHQSRSIHPEAVPDDRHG